MPRLLLFKMATYVLRYCGVRNLAQLVLWRQNLRVVSSFPRIFFATDSFLQYPFLIHGSVVARPFPFGVRSFADVGASLAKEEIQTRVLNVLKLFDKIDAEKVKVSFG